VGGTGILNQLPSVQSLTLAELARLMIVLSDNLATNALIELLGFEGVNDWCDRATRADAAAASHDGRRRARAGLDNFTSASDAAASLCWLLRDGSLLAPA
jgi:beta-lactamase class A